MKGFRSTAAVAIGICLLAGSLAAVTAQEEETAAAPRPPVEISGRIECGPPVRPDREEALEVGEAGLVLTRYRDGAWRQSGPVSDPRLEGDWYHTWESDTYALPGAIGGAEVHAATWRIENEAGAWSSTSFGATLADGTTIEPQAAVLVGEGAYEGLTAIVGLTDVAGQCAVGIRGLIFEDAPSGESYRPE